MVTVPLFQALTKPFSTLAIFEFEEDQITFLFVALLGKTVYERLFSSPSVRFTVCSSSATEVTLILVGFSSSFSSSLSSSGLIISGISWEFLSPPLKILVKSHPERSKPIRGIKSSFFFILFEFKCSSV